MTCGFSTNTVNGTKREECVEWGNYDLDSYLKYRDDDNGWIGLVIYLLIAVPVGVILCFIAGCKIFLINRERNE